jgi:hypothetical protein
MRTPDSKRVLSPSKKLFMACYLFAGLIAAGISIAIIAVVQGVGANLNTTFGTVQTALK